MKRYLMIGAIVAISLFNIAVVFTQPSSADEDNLTCASAGCPKGPGCNTSGTHNVCNLSCSDNTLVICPKSGEND
jgi:hypothetical protein